MVHQKVETEELMKESKRVGRMISIKRSHCPHIHDLARESEVTVSSVALDFHAVTEVINDEPQT